MNNNKQNDNFKLLARPMSTNLAYQPKDQSEFWGVKLCSNLSRKGVPCCSIAIWSRKSDLPGYYRQESGRKTVSYRSWPWVGAIRQSAYRSQLMIHSMTHLSDVQPHPVLSIFVGRREQREHCKMDTLPCRRVSIDSNREHIRSRLRPDISIERHLDLFPSSLGPSNANSLHSQYCSSFILQSNVQSTIKRRASLESIIKWNFVFGFRCYFDS